MTSEEVVVLLIKLRSWGGLRVSHPHFGGASDLMERAAVEIENLRSELIKARQETADWKLSFEAANEIIGKLNGDQHGHA